MNQKNIVDIALVMEIVIKIVITSLLENIKSKTKLRNSKRISNI